MGIRSRTMYSLHLVTRRFTRLRCVPKKTRRQDTRACTSHKFAVINTGHLLAGVTEILGKCKQASQNFGEKILGPSSIHQHL